MFTLHVLSDAAYYLVNPIKPIILSWGCHMSSYHGRRTCGAIVQSLSHAWKWLLSMTDSFSACSSTIYIRAPPTPSPATAGGSGAVKWNAPLPQLRGHQRDLGFLHAALTGCCIFSSATRLPTVCHPAPVKPLALAAVGNKHLVASRSMMLCLSEACTHTHLAPRRCTSTFPSLRLSDHISTQ